MLFSAQVNASLESRKLQFYCELLDAEFDSIVLDKPVGGAVGRLIQLGLSFDSCLFFLKLMVGSHASDIICLNGSPYKVFCKLFEFKSINKLNPSWTRILTVLWPS